MITVFERDDVINFVDTNNVFVGFDFSSQCCELFGWYLADKPEPVGSSLYPECPQGNADDVEELKSYIFCPEWSPLRESGIDDDDVEHGEVRFKLLPANGESGLCKYLAIYNEHNGYYAHGFKFCNDGVVIMEGDL